MRQGAGGKAGRCRFDLSMPYTGACWPSVWKWKKSARLQDALEGAFPGVFLAAERPLSEQVDRHLLVRMLLYLRVLERSWLKDDVEQET